VELKSYADIDNHAATWFIDPPYQKAGKRYKQNRVDYVHLGHWAKERRGQVIVCEQEGADWLDFQPFQQSTNGSNKTYSEVIWTRSDREYVSPLARFFRKSGPTTAANNNGNAAEHAA
jgi:16S rRNA G966 N2-methylase RsmD